ncbi:flavin reductase family protein [Pullulanibacillus camelliae]|nr:flavin reductase family protein [Pullulanibacillus camelliae]
MNERQYREAMGKFATGVTVVTTLDEEEIHGMTANAFMSVSLHPQLVLISIDQKAMTLRKIEKTGVFAISILANTQKQASKHFAGQLQEIDDKVFDWFNDFPVIRQALAYLLCRVHDTYAVGDHTLFIAEVVDLEVKDGLPLVFYQGRYHQLEDK